MYIQHGLIYLDIFILEIFRCTLWQCSKHTYETCCHKMLYPRPPLCMMSFIRRVFIHLENETQDCCGQITSKIVKNFSNIAFKFFILVTIWGSKILLTQFLQFRPKSMKFKKMLCNDFDKYILFYFMAFWTWLSFYFHSLKFVFFPSFSILVTIKVRSITEKLYKIESN